MTTADSKAAQEAEWGRYQANEPIFVDGVRAANAGDPVPVDLINNGTVLLEQVTDLHKAKTMKKES